MNKLNPFALSASQYVKAIVAGLIAALAVLGTALDGGVTTNEALGVLSAFLVGFYGTFLAPNKAAAGPGNPNLSEQDAGHGAVDGLIGLVIVLACIFAILKILGAIF